MKKLLLLLTLLLISSNVYAGWFVESGGGVSYISGFNNAEFVLDPEITTDVPFNKYGHQIAKQSNLSNAPTLLIGGGYVFANNIAISFNYNYVKTQTSTVKELCDPIGFNCDVLTRFMLNRFAINVTKKMPITSFLYFNAGLGAFYNYVKLSSSNIEIVYNHLHHEMNYHRFSNRTNNSLNSVGIDFSPELELFLTERVSLALDYKFAYNLKSMKYNDDKGKDSSFTLKLRIFT